MPRPHVAGESDICMLIDYTGMYRTAVVRGSVHHQENSCTQKEDKGSDSGDPPVTVKLHDSATLPCFGRCPGSARWTVTRTSCRSVKEGYQMIHEEYLKGNFSLIITRADFSKRGWYTCNCDSRDVCDVQLKIEPLNTTVEIMPGQSLILRLDVSDPVEVIYNSTATPGASGGQICTVDGGSLQCKPEYTQRAVITSDLVLREVSPSDSGVYAVMDKRSKDVIHTYTVAVQDVRKTRVWKDGYQEGSADGYQKADADGYQRGLGVGAGAVGIVLLAVGVILGIFAAPHVRPLIQRFRGEDPSARRGEEGSLREIGAAGGGVDVPLAGDPQPERGSQSSGD
ncbi:hypothetical protein NFI96_000448 [Prochilodus magdalenae]|nr:hypothetical protein NFI96_000448 [Prochilodus magdalenae]